MGVELQPLEFTDCLTDSPLFRENLHKHENELHKTSQQIKRLIKEVKDLLHAAKILSQAQRTLAESLMKFKFECIGGSKTDDETVIVDSLKEISKMITGIEDERDRMLKIAYDQIITPLEIFRKEHIGAVKEEKKKYDKQTAKFCQTQERYLNMSTKKQENVLVEADVQVQMAERHFCQASLDYVFRLQEVQERKKFEFVETLLRFICGWFTFYHQGYEVAKEFKPFMDDLQLRIQKTRNNFEQTKNKTEELKKKMLDRRQTQNPEESVRPNKELTKEGYLFLMEKKAFGTTWTKQYCKYEKETKTFIMTPYNQLTSKAILSPPIKMTLASCTRRMSDSIEKRFCFDISCEDRPGSLYTLQALSEEDRNAWIDVMDGKEPTYSAQGKLIKPEERPLDDIGFSFVKRCIEVLDKRGLEEQGLYRIVGVTSKVNKLLTMGLDRRKAADKLSNLDDRLEWESKTITSALKQYLRNLPESLMTFKYHSSFIAAAKQETRQLRVNDVHKLVHRLPSQNLKMLEMLIKHLKNVSQKCDKNLMTVSNLAVCFGPTLLRPEEETVASIMDIKFYNVVVEILIENYEIIFHSAPDTSDGQTEMGASPQSISAGQNSNHTNSSQNNSHRNPQQTSHTSRYSNSPPVTHAVTKTYCDGPISLNMSSSLHNVATMHDQELNGGMPYGNTTGVMSHSEHLVGGMNGGGTDRAFRGPPNLHRISTTTMSAYSEGNLHNMHGYSPSHNKHRSSAVSSYHHSSGLGDIRNDTFNSTSSSNESVSSISQREGINSNHTSSHYSPHNSSPQKTKRGNMGAHYAKNYRPHGSVSVQSASTSTSGRSSPSLSMRRVRTLYACLGENDGELSFEPNQIITNVKTSLEPGWLEGTLNGKTGLVPENYVEVLP